MKQLSKRPADRKFGGEKARSNSLGDVISSIPYNLAAKPNRSTDRSCNTRWQADLETTLRYHQPAAAYERIAEVSKIK